MQFEINTIVFWGKPFNLALSDPEVLYGVCDCSHSHMVFGRGEV